MFSHCDLDYSLLDVQCVTSANGPTEISGEFTTSLCHTPCTQYATHQKQMLIPDDGTPHWYQILHSIVCKSLLTVLCLGELVTLFRTVAVDQMRTEEVWTAL